MTNHLRMLYLSLPGIVNLNFYHERLGHIRVISLLLLKYSLKNIWGPTKLYIPL